jgi:hypothetical protein
MKPNFLTHFGCLAAVAVVLLASQPGRVAAQGPASDFAATALPIPTPKPSSPKDIVPPKEPTAEPAPKAKAGDAEPKKDRTPLTSPAPGPATIIAPSGLRLRLRNAAARPAVPVPATDPKGPTLDPQFGPAVPLIPAAPEAARGPVGGGPLFDRAGRAPRAFNPALVRPPADQPSPAVSGSAKLLLDPANAGAGPLPTTPTDGELIVGGDVRADVANDSTRLGDSLQFRPKFIPVRGEAAYGLDRRSNMFTGKAIGSRFLIEGVYPTESLGEAHFVADTAFVLPVNGQDTNLPGGGATVRQLNLYGEVDNVIVGMTNSLFLDQSAYPSTVDGAGPNALGDLGRALVGYWFRDLYQDGVRQVFATVTLEQPTPQVTSADAANGGSYSGRARFPDVVVQAILADATWGYVRVAGVGRDLGIENVAYGSTPASDDATLGWGVQCSGGFTPFTGSAYAGSDLVRFSVTHGRGIAAFVGDLQTSGLDAAVDADGSLRALPATAFFASYTHFWTPKVHSTLVYSQVTLDALDAPLLTEAYREGRYVAANLIYQWNTTAAGGKTVPLFAGVEFLYGKKELQSGETGDAHRVQVTFGASF